MCAEADRAVDAQRGAGGTSHNRENGYDNDRQEPRVDKSSSGSEEDQSDV